MSYLPIIILALLALLLFGAWGWMAMSSAQVFDHEDERRKFDEWEEME